jgi:hypothetical protein
VRHGKSKVFFGCPKNGEKRTPREIVICRRRQIMETEIIKIYEKVAMVLFSVLVAALFWWAWPTYEYSYRLWAECLAVIHFLFIISLLVYWAVVIFKPGSVYELKNQFDVSFGFYPKKNRITADYQKIIDLALKEKAKKLDAASRSEKDILNEQPNATDTVGLIDFLTKKGEKIAQAKKDFQAVWKEFWAAHKLAKRFGYNTFPKWGDYLKEWYQA